MGCTQSQDAVQTSAHQQTDRFLLPRNRVPSTIINRSRRSLSQLLVVQSFKQNSGQPSIRATHSHRDVFSIFAERGMVLEPDQEATTVVSYMMNDGLFYSPCNASRSSAFSTATTASDNNTDSQRATVRGPRDQFMPSLQVSYGVCSDKGIRKQNEDRSVCTSQIIHGEEVAFFGVYDGHGGAKVAEYLTKHLHQAVYERLRQYPVSIQAAIEHAFAATDDAIFDKEMESGSTACTVMMRGRQLVIANVGDSQAVVCSSGKARAVSVIHSPDALGEKERILAANGVVTKGRIFGLLGVSRSFGDNDFKTSRGEFKDKFKGDLVIATPDCIQMELTSEDEFVIVACDGLYEVMQPQQVVDFVRAKLALHGEVQHACEELVSYAISIGSTDNVSVIIISLNQLAIDFSIEVEDGI